MPEQNVGSCTVKNEAKLWKFKSFWMKHWPLNTSNDFLRPNSVYCQVFEQNIREVFGHIN